MESQLSLTLSLQYVSHFARLTRLLLQPTGPEFRKIVAQI